MTGATLQEDALQLAVDRSAVVDALVQNAYGDAQLLATVVAVGGYGRRELFPYSDIDLLLLVDSTPEPPERERIATFLRTLWDSGLRISQSVHTVSECCELHAGNLELTISLLDRRLLCGNPARFAQLEARFAKFLNSQRETVTAHLAKMTRVRHTRYNDTIYHLEPNVKEHPGGLRDLHVVHWFERMQAAPQRELGESRAFLFSVRTSLHRHFGRDHNALTFEAQDQLWPDPAVGMRDYYRHARVIHRSLRQTLDETEGAHTTLLRQFRDWRSRLSNADFTVINERVLLRNPGQLSSDPTVIDRLLDFMARHRLRLAPDTERRLSEACWGEGARWPQLRNLFANEHASAALRVLADVHLLESFLPEWSGIDCLVVRDFYHLYTVDEHTLTAIRTLEGLRESKDPLRQRFAELLAEVDAPELLRVALLLHDIGKGGGDHVAHSSEIAARVFERWQMPDKEAETVLFLIDRHLHLSSAMTSRDLLDPATAREIAEATGTVERLRLLTLLTYADISAVNPSAMSPWRLEQLWRAYLAGHEELTRELASDRIGAAEDLPADLAKFVQGLPTRYLKTHSLEEIRAHAALGEPGMGAELTHPNGSYRLTAVAPDRPFLLASVSGVLAGFGMNILKAEAFSNARGQVVDAFVFADPHRTLELNPDEAERLRDAVLRALQGKLDVAAMLKTRRRTQAPGHIPPSVTLNNEASDSSTLIEIVAEDRPGLLYDLTYAISSVGADIDIVLIDTEAHRALDVFYVRQNGGKLLAKGADALRLRLLAICGGSPPQAAA